MDSFAEYVLRFASLMVLAFIAHELFHRIRDRREAYSEGAVEIQQMVLRSNETALERAERLRKEGVALIHATIGRENTIDQHTNPKTMESWVLRTFDATKRDEVEHAYLGRCDRCKRCDCRMCDQCYTRRCRSQWYPGSAPIACEGDDLGDWEGERQSYSHPEALEDPTLCFGLMRAFVRYREADGEYPEWSLVLCESCAHDHGVRVGWCNCDNGDRRRPMFGACSKRFAGIY